MTADPSPARRARRWPDRLAVGIQLPIQSQSTRYAQPWEADAGAAELTAVVEAAEASGLDYVAVCDHVAIPDPEVAAMSDTWYDTVATLSWIAGLTRRVDLLSHVYVPAYRHPAVVAKAWATLDHLSGGRAVLGVGAGHVEGEFALLGVDHATRGRITDDRIGALREAWTTGRVGDGHVAPLPAQDGGPPIWIGGSSPAALRRAGRLGDGWLPQGTPYEAMPDAVEAIHRAQIDAHGDRWPIDVGLITSPLHVGDPGFEPSPDTFVGDGDRLARGLARLSGLGATHLQVRFAARSAAEYAEQLERFGRHVLPRLHDVG